MDPRLIPVNAFIALASPRTTSWPNTLFEIGYRLEGLEIPVTAGGGRIVIDGVAFNAATNRFLDAEGKSGNNLKEEQAHRYGLVDPRDLVRLIGVTISAPGELSAAPIYVCLEDATQRILLGLEAADCRYPVLSVGAERVVLHGGPPDDPAIANAFREAVHVPGPPPGVILVDDHSDDSEFDPIVAAALVAEVAQGSEVISCPSIAARGIPYLDLFASGHRNTLLKSVTRAARRACDAAPESFEFRDSTQARPYAVVKVIDSPEKADPRGRTQRYQAIKGRIAGTPPEEVDTTQGSLFDEIDLAAELEKADTGEPDTDEPEEESR
ncbi:MAG: hypothetical protein M3P85_00675 [Actinomycetota bacterium]|nr:hypothetical protein [Actinomycetota bacterium]